MNIDEVLTRGVEQIIPSKEALKSLMQKRQITLYQGFDPTAPSLHLGNLVGLIKLRQFQQLGHKVIFLVGDFTGMIGDPTDKLAVRKKLTRKQVLENTKKWYKQVERILDFNGKNPAKIMFNSKWNDKLAFKDLIEIASNLTVQQMIERDMFQERIKRNAPIYLHEFLYPVAQGYDSVYMNVDLEIGGNDQLFNMMVGRTLAKALKGKEKFVLTTKLLVDKEGNKVGKTTGNALFLDSGPANFYAGIMSFPDESIFLGFELFTDLPLAGLPRKIKDNPMQEKKHLAFEIVKLVWGEKEAKRAQKKFENTFQKQKPTFDTKVKNLGTLAKTIAPYTSRKSISEAKRLIAEKAVEVNGKAVQDPTYKIKKGDKIKVGEKIFLEVK